METLVKLLMHRGSQQGANTAYTYLHDDPSQNTSLTYQELDTKARVIALRLMELGVEGKPVLLLFEPGLDYIAAFFGCLYAGGYAVPAYPPQRAKHLPRLLSIVKDSGANVALTSTFLFDQIKPFINQGFAGYKLDWLTTNTLEGTVDSTAKWTPPAVHPDTLAFLQYTSGSTGTPKGVMLTHGNLLENCEAIKVAFSLNETHRGAGWLPLYHDMGLIGQILGTLHIGFPFSLITPLQFLQKPFRWLKAMSDTKAHITGAPNFAFDLCVQKVTDEQKSQLDLSHLALAVTGAEPVRMETIRAFSKAFKSCGFREEAFYPSYGLAESSLMVTGGLCLRPVVTRRILRQDLENSKAVLAPETSPLEKTFELVSSGFSRTSHKTIVVNPETEELCRDNEVGEIWSAGPSIAKGYWNRPDESSQVFHGLAKNNEGDPNNGRYLRTGDLGFINDGELYVTGRLKDLMIIRGRNIYPQDVESSFQAAHKDLRPGYGSVFSIDVEGEERVVAVQEIESSASGPAKDIFDAAFAAVSTEHELQLYAMVLLKKGELPITSSGKVQRRQARSQYLAGKLDVVASWKGDVITGEIQKSTAMGERLGEIFQKLSHALGAALSIPAEALDAKKALSDFALPLSRAIPLSHQIQDSLDIEIPYSVFLSEMSLNDLAAAVDRKLSQVRESHPKFDVQFARFRTPLVPIAVVPRDGDLSVSFTQESLWTQIAEGLHPKNTDHRTTLLRLRGPLDVKTLEQSLAAVTLRHEALRSRFKEVDGQWQIEIATDPSPTFIHEDWRGRDAKTELETRLDDIAALTFTGPEASHMRCDLLQLGDHEHILLLTVHQSLCDRRSMHILISDLIEAYPALKKGLPINRPALPLQFVDYAAWQLDPAHGKHLGRQVAFWQQRMTPLPPPLAIRTGRPAERSYAMASIEAELGKNVGQQVKRLAAERGVHPLMLFSFAYAVFLKDLSGTGEVAFATILENRLRSEATGMIGPFSNSIALRCNFSDGEALAKAFAHFRSDMLDAIANQDLPLAFLQLAVEAPLDQPHAPLVQASFEFREAESKRFLMENLIVMVEDVPQRYHIYDLNLIVSEQGATWKATFHYNKSLFSGDVAGGWNQRFSDLLVQGMESVDSSLTEVKG